MEGWIKIHRQIKDHWLWSSERRLKWWIDILLTVNHQDSKIFIKGNLIECKRGQSVRSLESWAKDWNVTKKAVRDFFRLLEKDQMLYTEPLCFTTRITVCNYDTYQTEVNGKKIKSKRSGNAQETLRVPKQEGEEEKEYIYSAFYDQQIIKANDDEYRKFVAWLFKENEIGRPFEQCLSLKDQIGYDQFVNLKRIAKENGTKITDKIKTLENNFKKYTPTSLNLTLCTWLKRKY